MATALFTGTDDSALAQRARLLARRLDTILDELPQEVLRKAQR
jgi:hypothetical protein